MFFCQAVRIWKAHHIGINILEAYVKFNRTWIVILVSLVLIACNMSEAVSSTTMEPASTETPTATREEENIESTSESASPADQDNDQPAAETSPTTEPPAPAPTASNPGSNPGGSSSSSSGQSLSINNVTSQPNTSVYYGACDPADPTVLHVEGTIDPLDQIQEVLLWYDISDATGIVTSGYVTMWQLGIGDYAGDVDIDQIASGPMGTNDGSVSFWIEAENKDGDSYYSSTYSVNIIYRPTSVVGNPPAAPPVITSFTDNGPIQAGEWVELAWQTTDADCGVTLDGGSVDANGYFSYQTSAGDAGSTFTHTLVASGAPCSNPAQTSETVSIAITAASTTAKGSGTLYDGQSLDLGDGGSVDIMFNINGSDIRLLSMTGSNLMPGLQPDAAMCASQLSGGGYGVVTIDVNDLVCYKTDSGYYGYLTITGMYIDLDNIQNTYIDLSYSTEITP